MKLTSSSSLTVSRSLQRPALAAIALATLAAAHAATVSYSTATFQQDGSNVSILSNSGTLLGAVNFSNGPRTGTFDANNPDPNVTVNGITFTAVNGAVAGVGGTLSGVGYVTGNGGGAPAGLDTNRPSNVSFAAAPSLYGLVYDVIRSDSNANPLTFNLTNLQAGTVYQVQFIFSASDAARRLYLDSTSAAAAGAGILTYGTGSGPGLLTGTFTADAATQNFTFYNTNAGGQRVSLAAFTLSVVPEPSGSALAGLGALLWLARRRRA